MGDEPAFSVRTALGNGDSSVWLSNPWPDGSRSFVALRELAATFPTADIARASLDDLPEIFREAVTEFWIESD
jgi:hypothetical protein